MIITKLYLESFGKFRDRTIELGDGMNVIQGDNETGKTTVSAFIFGMLFGIEKQRESDGTDLYARFLPWDDPEHFGGYMEFVKDANRYRLTRSFLATNRRFILYDLSSDREVFDGEEAFKEMLPDLDADEYIDTYFCLEDSKAPGAKLANAIKRHISEAESDINAGIDVDYALKLLDERRMELTDRESEARVSELSRMIRDEEKIEQELDRLAGMEQEVQSELDNLNAQLSEAKEQSLFEKKEQEYYSMREQYGIYKKDLETYRDYSEQLEKTIIMREKLDDNAVRLERCREELATVRDFKKNTQDKVNNKSRELDNLMVTIKNAHSNVIMRQVSLIVLVATLLVLAVALILTHAGPLPVVITLIFLVVSVGALIIMSFDTRRRNIDNRLKHERLKSDLRELKRESEIFYSAHSSEDELQARYEAFLKEDGRRPETLARENELSGKLESLNVKLENQKQELFDFFAAFGMVESLKDDELALQEKMLVDAKKKRKETTKGLREKIDEVNEKLYKLRAKVEADNDNQGKLIRHREELERLKDVVARNKKEVEATKLASKIIESIAAESNKNIGTILGQKASAYAASFTENKYTSFVMDNRLNCRVDYLDKFVPVERLSKGATSQLNLALRLTAGDLIWEKTELPRIFDDAFVYYDDSRLAKALKELAAAKGQNIIMTCHNRAELILSQLDVDFNFIKL